MERLTFKDSNGNVHATKVGYYDIIDKLEQYEELEEKVLEVTGADIASMVGEYMHYYNLQKENRLLELPCKVGDVVYCEEKCNVHEGIQAFQITNILISQNKKGKWTKKYRAMLLLNGKTIDWQLNFDFEELGKTVFLTKEEAEKALAEMEKEHGRS